MKVSPRIAAPQLIHFAALLLWAFAPTAASFPAFPVVLAELSLAALLFPSARMNFRTPLTPMNWALFMWQVHAIAVPLLAMWFGFDPGMLPRLPGVYFINLAMLLSAVAHLCFCVGAQLAALHRPSAASPAPLFSKGLDTTLSCAFVVIGLGAMVLLFGGPAGYLEYVTNPSNEIFKDTGAPASFSGAMGTLLRPFLSLGLVLGWSTFVRHQKHGRALSFLATVLLVVAIIPATANYNRASMVGPVLAVLAAYSVAVKRLSARTVGLIGAALLVGAFAVGAYRSVRLAGVAASREDEMSPTEKVNAFLQVYAAGPQFTGFILERAGDQLHLGSTMFSSVLYPIPVLGKSFRATSGFVFYNRLIYGRFGITDQVIPADAELFLNFHLAGVALFFAAVGFAVRKVHGWFQQARTGFGAAACYLVATWLAFPIVGAVSVVSQILFYSFWPFYAYFGLRGLLGAWRAPAHSRGAWAWA